MNDIITLQRMSDIIKALDKMHNGLLALIEAHQDLERDLDERIKKLEAGMEGSEDGDPRG